MSNLNELYLRRKMKVVIKEEKNSLSNNYITTILKNIEQYNVVFDELLINKLKTLSINSITNFYNELIDNLKLLTGDNFKYNPLYPNFPSQVMNMNEYTIFSNSQKYYNFIEEKFPKYDKETRPILDEQESNMKIIKLGNKEELDSIFTNLLGANISLSQQDKDDIKTFVNIYNNDIKSIMPQQIPIKENMIYICNLLINKKLNYKIVLKYFNTATDVLRLITAMSDGDITLKTNTFFRKYTKSECKFLLNLLNSINNIEEDMNRKKLKYKWIRVGEKLKPTKKYKNAYNAFYKIRNNIHIYSFNSEYEKHIKNNDFKKAIKLLKTRPGEFARRLNFLLEHYDNNYIIDNFKDISNKLPSSILLQLMSYFKNRNNQSDIRTFLPKGNAAQFFSISNLLDDISQTTCDNIVNICKKSLIYIYSQRDLINNVYINKSIKNYIVPFSQRSNSYASKILTRGSKINIDKNINILRTFIHWKNTNEDVVDIDLSMIFYDKNWDYVDDISYNNIKIDKFNCCHSGDITNAPNGASEFIDLDLSSLKNNNIKFAICSINSFNGQVFNEIPELFFGWMKRKNSNSGEIYEPKTVENKINITGNNLISIPFVLNVYDKQIIWSDMSLSHNVSYINNVRNHKNDLSILGKSIVEINKPNLYDLISLNVRARGELSNIQDANIIFNDKQISFNDYKKLFNDDINNSEDKEKTINNIKNKYNELKIITPFDNDIIIGEYL